jgi:glutamate formiminotransferase
MGDGGSDGLLECVPNVSEGRDGAVVRLIGRAFASAGAYLADTHTDADHNRSVYTLFGTSEQLRAGVAAAAHVTAEHVDLGAHVGVHPRVGALDVVPVVPLAGYVHGGADELDAVLLADEIAHDLAAAHELPVLRYGAGSASGLERTGHVRTRGDLAERLASGELVAFAGPSVPHPRLGAVMVGVRDVLVACNAELATTRLRTATDIAAVVRETAGGLAGVRALGLTTPARHSVQLSANCERWRDAGPAELLERVLDLAAVVDTDVASFELVGLAPRDSMHDLGIACRRNRISLRTCREPGLEIRARLAASRVRQ